MTVKANLPGSPFDIEARLRGRSAGQGDGRKPFEPALLGDQVAAALRAEIVEGDLQPGSRIVLDDYRVRWNVSITPLRDAVKKMESDGLVRVAPRRGVFVAEVDETAINEIFEVRLALEPVITQLATPCIPPDIATEVHAAYEATRSMTRARREKRLREIDELVHDVVLHYCPNSQMRRVLAGLRDIIQWSRNALVSRAAQPFEPSLNEHIALAAALARHDANAARDAMHTHLINTRARGLKWIGESTSARRKDG